jgi:Na+/H+ antiporter NhaD/arsenite permease-like protein
MPADAPLPSLLWVSPFVLMLLAIAILPLVPRAAAWWHHNSSKLLVALCFAALTLAHYYLRGFGIDHGGRASAPGLATVLSVLHHAILDEYLPFISLLFSLYVISGGICLRGDLPAHPLTNTAFLAAGGLLASLVGTTGASMLLIRPLLRTNSERRHVVHTVVFFVFIVSNVGGSLLPIGDPPLFLGYLRGVPFLWTLSLWKEWATALALLLGVYFLVDHFCYYPRETPRRILLDETVVQPMRIDGTLNLLWIAGVVLATGTLDPSRPFPGTGWTPFPWLREVLQLAFVGLSLRTTPRAVHQANEFNYAAILEVACLFLGIFVCMQVPIELLNARGAALGLNSPAGFFWATGLLSSFLDNAPTYVVFFETANALTHAPGPGILRLLSGHYIREDLLTAISLGAVFMGANTYIGNGPNFMVKSIAERAGVKMPSFFGYMLYSGAILLPIFGFLTLLFLR